MTQEVRKPQVAFLTANFEVAKKMGQLFKKLSLVLDTFLSPEDFLISHLTSKFDLVFIDLDAALYEGSPIISRKELRNTNLAFFVSGASAMPLVANTYSVDHLGYIFSNLDVVGQVKNILLRFNTLNKLKSEVNYYNSYKYDVLPKHENLVKSYEELRENFSKTQGELNLISKISKVSKQVMSFNAVLENTLEGCESVKSYNFLKLSQDGMKLIPNDLKFSTASKNMKIPAVWLGKKNEMITDLVVGLAQNIATSVTEFPLVSLLMSKDGISVDSLILIEVNSQSDLKLNWELVESTLCGVYSQFENKTVETVSKQTILSPFDLLNVFNGTVANENLHLLAFDLSDIFDFKNLRDNITFDWAEFWSDFKIRLANIISDGQIYTISPEQVVIIVDDFIFEESFQASKEFCGKLALSKYFSGLENYEVNAAKISLKEIPFSEYALLSNLGRKSTKMDAKSREL